MFELNFDFEVQKVIVVVLTATLQSVFGVGLLLVGTPLLVLLGNEFLDVLMILLPISLTVSLFQFLPNRGIIDKNFIKKILKFSSFGVIAGLLLTIKYQLNIKILIGAALIAMAVLPRIIKANERMVSSKMLDNLYFLVMGLVHGLSNLGGSMLTARVNLEDNKKLQARTIVSFSYFLFVMVQMTVILVSGHILSISIFYVGIGVAVNFIGQYVIFKNMSHEFFRKAMNLFVIAIGFFLIIQGISD